MSHPISDQALEQLFDDTYDKVIEIINKAQEDENLYTDQGRRNFAEAVLKQALNYYEEVK